MRPTAADRCAVGASALLGAMCALCVITYSGSSEGIFIEWKIGERGAENESVYAMLVGALGSALGTRSMAGVSAPLRGSSWVTNAIRYVESSSKRELLCIECHPNKDGKLKKKSRVRKQKI